MRGIYKTREIAQGLDAAVEDFKTKKIRKDLENIRVNIENMKIDIAIEEDKSSNLNVKRDNIQHEINSLDRPQIMDLLMKVQDIQIFNRFRLCLTRRRWKKALELVNKDIDNLYKHINELRESLLKSKDEYQTKINMPFYSLFYYIYYKVDQKRYKMDWI